MTLRIRFLSALLGCAALTLPAAPAAAHGPTVVLSAERAEPGTLEIERGQTVHFRNASDATLRVRADADAFTSPELPAGGEGWHLRFPFPGRFEYAVEGAPGVRGAIAVE